MALNGLQFSKDSFKIKRLYRRPCSEQVLRTTRHDGSEALLLKHVGGIRLKRPRQINIMLLAICALVSMGVRTINLDTVNYVQDLRDVEKARKLLDSHVVNKEGSVSDPDLQYLAIAGVIRKAAKGLIKTRYAPVNSTQLLLHYLHKYPKVWSNPRKVVKKVQNLRDRTLVRLQPLNLYVKYICKNLEDSECNKNIVSQMQEDPDLQSSVRTLDLAIDVARRLLMLRPGKDPDLIKDIPFDVTSYILDNLEEVVEIVESVARLMEEVHPYLHY